MSRHFNENSLIFIIVNMTKNNSTPLSFCNHRLIQESLTHKKVSMQQQSPKQRNLQQIKILKSHAILSWANFLLQWDTIRKWHMWWSRDRRRHM